MSTNPPSQIVIDVTRQRLDLLSETGETVDSWPVSTSKNGLGTEEGSFQTPTGQFRICAKIGEGAPPWTIFKSRRETGVLASPGGEEDLILSRILWLDGLDLENLNTRDRHIYIHGTNQEELIGTPASHGCIRLRNDDMIALYERVTPQTLVKIKG